MYKKITITIASILVALSGAGTANAAQTSVVTDPVDDFASFGHNRSKEAYLDIVRAEISKTSDFTMTMNLAAPIPVTPLDPPGDDATLIWAFNLDTIPDVAPVGDPFPPGQGEGRDFEYLVVLDWDGASFHSYVNSTS
jgi:hypothetical protein